MAVAEEGMTRLEYLRLLYRGYAKDGALLPDALREEMWALEFDLAAEKAKEREEAQAKLREVEEALAWKREQDSVHEPDLIEYWHNQRQHGRTEAARLWWEKHGVEPWEITEIREQDDNEQANLRAARRQQGME